MKNMLAILTLTFALHAEQTYQLVDDQCTLKIVTPDLADLKTAKIRLANGLEAYVISDPGVHKSCAALAVASGNWLDPEQYPGMAHFLEHMLFMGTKPYPGESDYKNFMANHGGKFNAYTTTDRTVYGFSINNDAFHDGLDRFAHFFIDPLFIQNSVGRELHNIDQEHGKNLDHDGWRQFMILKETGNQNHPFAKFSTGNAETLKDIPRSALVQWYEENYSADRMHLVVVSPEPIKELINSTAQIFSTIPNRHLGSPHYPFEIFSEEQQGHMLYIDPVKDIKTLSLLWQLPRSITLDEESHAVKLVEYALSNQTQNSLCEELKREKLIEGMKASADHLSGEIHLMSIDFDLTEYGIKHLDTIIERTFQTLSRMKTTGIPHYIYDEHIKLSKMSYEHQSRHDAFEMAMNIAEKMPYESLETFPQKHVLATRYDEGQIKQLLTALTAETCLYVVSADPKHTGVMTTHNEKWMNAAYTMKSVDQNKLIAWSAVEPHPRIDVPGPNPYFPDSLALHAVENPSRTQPTALVKNDLGTVYFMQDQKYRVPKTAVIFAIKTPELSGNARSKALFDLYIRSLEDKLCSHLFFAHEAGLQVELSLKENDFVIALHGYSEKFPLFLQTIFSSLKEVSPTAQEFDIFKKSLLSEYDNASKEIALKQSMQLLQSVLRNNCPTPAAKYEALQLITYEQFLAFTSTVFHKAYVEGTIVGNLNQASAGKLWDEYLTHVSPTSFPEQEHYKKAVLIPDPNKPYMLVQSTERQGNGTLLLLHEGAFSQESRALQQILSSALGETFYDTLRSKQHTGYIAQSWDLEIEDQLVQLFGVQSISHEPSELLARFDLFLEDFCRDLKEHVTPERFETLKSTLIKNLAKPPENLPAKALQLHIFGFEKKGDFDWIEKRIAAAEALQYETFLQKAAANLSRQNRRRIAILMHGILPSHNQLRYEVVSQEQIKDTGSYISAR